jgi:hypothetical protein
MPKKLKSETKKEANKKGAERMRRFEENQKAPKKKEKVVVVDDNLICRSCWEKNVKAGDDDWHLRQVFYKKKEKA